MSARVRSIVEHLAGNGWTERPSPLRVGELAFDDFAALLEGPRDEHQLVLVLGPDADDPVRCVRALVRALERTGSTRPVTLILPSDDPDVRAELSKLCRVLTVPSDEVAKSLRSLVPLELPEPLEPVGPVDKALREVLGDPLGDPMVEALLEASRESAEKVEATLLEFFDRVEANGDEGT